MERKYRKKSTHLELDTLIPIDHKSVMQQDKQVHADSCFSHLWDVTTKACSLCADSEVCGILFHQRLKKRVAKLESSMPVTLDMNDFDGIDRNRLALWLSRCVGRKRNALAGIVRVRLRITKFKTLDHHSEQSATHPQASWHHPRF